MKKFFSMLTFAAIMFVATAVANAAGYIEAEISTIDFHPENGTIQLGITLYNTGDRPANVTALNIHELYIYDTAGNLLWSDSVNFTTVRNCYIDPGYHIANAQFTITNTTPPAYYQRTTYNWRYTVYWNNY